MPPHTSLQGYNKPPRLIRDAPSRISRDTPHRNCLLRASVAPPRCALRSPPEAIRSIQSRIPRVASSRNTQPSSIPDLATETPERRNKDGCECTLRGVHPTPEGWPKKLLQNPRGLSQSRPNNAPTKMRLLRRHAEISFNTKGRQWGKSVGGLKEKQSHASLHHALRHAQGCATRRSSRPRPVAPFPRSLPGMSEGARMGEMEIRWKSCPKAHWAALYWYV